MWFYLSEKLRFSPLCCCVWLHRHRSTYRTTHYFWVILLTLLEHSRSVSEYAFSLVLVLKLRLHGHNLLLSVDDASNDLLLTFKSCDVINLFGPPKPLEASLLLLFHYRAPSEEAALLLHIKCCDS